MTQQTPTQFGYGFPASAVFTDNGKRYVAAIRTRKSRPTPLYEAIEVAGHESSPYFGGGHDEEHLVLHPVADGTTRADVHNATIAEVKDGKWHFAHTAPATHHDDAEQLVSFIRTKFIPIIETLLNKVLQANSASVQAAREKLGRMRDYRDAIEEAAIAYLETKPLGYRHREPHLDHLRLDYQAVLTSVYKLWDTAGSEKSETANLALSSVALKEGHAVRTRLEILADEAKAAAKAAAETPAEPADPSPDKSAVQPNPGDQQ